MLGLKTKEVQPILIIKAGSSLDSLESVPVNSTESVQIKSEHFDGAISVRIVDFRGPQSTNNIPNPKDGFTLKEGASWSIVVHGRFLNDEPKAFDLLWGNVWSKPIRDYLPHGTSIITKYLQVKDPSISHDLYSDTPFALSPWLSTTQYVNLRAHSSELELPLLDPSSPVEENVIALFTSHEKNKNVIEKVGAGTNLESWKGEPKFRKDFMGVSSQAEEIVLTQDMVVTAEFAHGHIDFKTLSVKVPLLPQLPLAKHWDGQPITYVLRNRSTQLDYLYVTFAIGSEEDEESANEEEKEEKVHSDVD